MHVQAFHIRLEKKQCEEPAWGPRLRKPDDRNHAQCVHRFMNRSIDVSSVVSCEYGYISICNCIYTCIYICIYMYIYVYTTTRLNKSKLCKQCCGPPTVFRPSVRHYLLRCKPPVSKLRFSKPFRLVWSSRSWAQFFHRRPLFSMFRRGRLLPSCSVLASTAKKCYII